MTRIVEAIAKWPQAAADLGVRTETRKLVGGQLNGAYGINRGLLVA